MHFGVILIQTKVIIKQIIEKRKTFWEKELRMKIKNKVYRD